MAGVAFLALPGRSEATALTFDCHQSSSANPFCAAEARGLEAGSSLLESVGGDEPFHLAFDLGRGVAFVDVLTDLAADRLRVALTIGPFAQRPEIASLQSTSSTTPPAAPTPVPEPASLLLFGSGLAGLAGLARRIRRKTR